MRLRCLKKLPQEKVTGVNAAFPWHNRHTTWSSSLSNPIGSSDVTRSTCSQYSNVYAWLLSRVRSLSPQETLVALLALQPAYHSEYPSLITHLVRRVESNGCLLRPETCVAALERFVPGLVLLHSSGEEDESTESTRDGGGREKTALSARDHVRRVCRRGGGEAGDMSANRRQRRVTSVQQRQTSGEGEGHLCQQQWSSDAGREGSCPLPLFEDALEEASSSRLVFSPIVDDLVITLLTQWELARPSVLSCDRGISPYRSDDAPCSCSSSSFSLSSSPSAGALHHAEKGVPETTSLSSPHRTRGRHSRHALSPISPRSTPGPTLPNSTHRHAFTTNGDEVFSSFIAAPLPWWWWLRCGALLVTVLSESTLSSARVLLAHVVSDMLLPLLPALSAKEWRAGGGGGRPDAALASVDPRGHRVVGVRQVTAPACSLESAPWSCSWSLTFSQHRSDCDSNGGCGEGHADKVPTPNTLWRSVAHLRSAADLVRLWSVVYFRTHSMLPFHVWPLVSERYVSALDGFTAALSAVCLSHYTLTPPRSGVEMEPAQKTCGRDDDDKEEEEEEDSSLIRAADEVFFLCEMLLCCTTPAAFHGIEMESNDNDSGTSSGSSARRIDTERRKLVHLLLSMMEHLCRRKGKRCDTMIARCTNKKSQRQNIEKQNSPDGTTRYGGTDQKCWVRKSMTSATRCPARASDHVILFTRLTHVLHVVALQYTVLISESPLPPRSSSYDKNCLSTAIPHPSTPCLDHSTDQTIHPTPAQQSNAPQTVEEGAILLRRFVRLVHVYWDWDWAGEEGRRIAGGRELPWERVGPQLADIVHVVAAMGADLNVTTPRSRSCALPFSHSDIPGVSPLESVKISLLCRGCNVLYQDCVPSPESRAVSTLRREGTGDGLVRWSRCSRAEQAVFLLSFLHYWESWIPELRNEALTMLLRRLEPLLRCEGYKSQSHHHNKSIIMNNIKKDQREGMEKLGHFSAMMNTIGNGDSWLRGGRCWLNPGWVVGEWLARLWRRTWSREHYLALQHQDLMLAVLMVGRRAELRRSAQVQRRGASDHARHFALPQRVLEVDLLGLCVAQLQELLKHPETGGLEGRRLVFRRPSGEAEWRVGPPPPLAAGVCRIGGGRGGVSSSSRQRSEDATARAVSGTDPSLYEDLLPLLYALSTVPRPRDADGGVERQEAREWPQLEWCGGGGETSPPLNRAYDELREVWRFTAPSSLEEEVLWMEERQRRRRREYLEQVAGVRSGTSFPFCSPPPPPPTEENHPSTVNVNALRSDIAHAHVSGVMPPPRPAVFSMGGQPVVTAAASLPHAVPLLRSAFIWEVVASGAVSTVAAANPPRRHPPPHSLTLVSVLGSNAAAHSWRATFALQALYLRLCPLPWCGDEGAGVGECGGGRGSRSRWTRRHHRHSCSASVPRRYTCAIGVPPSALFLSSHLAQRQSRVFSLLYQQLVHHVLQHWPLPPPHDSDHRDAFPASPCDTGNAGSSLLFLPLSLTYSSLFDTQKQLWIREWCAVVAGRGASHLTSSSLGRDERIGCGSVAALVSPQELYHTLDVLTHCTAETWSTVPVSVMSEVWHALAAWLESTLLRQRCATPRSQSVSPSSLTSSPSSSSSSSLPAPPVHRVTQALFCGEPNPTAVAEVLAISHRHLLLCEAFDALREWVRLVCDFVETEWKEKGPGRKAMTMEAALCCGGRPPTSILSDWEDHVLYEEGNDNCVERVRDDTDTGGLDGREEKDSSENDVDALTAAFPLALLTRSGRRVWSDTAGVCTSPDLPLALPSISAISWTSFVNPFMLLDYFDRLTDVTGDDAGVRFAVESSPELFTWIHLRDGLLPERLWPSPVVRRAYRFLQQNSTTSSLAQWKGTWTPGWQHPREKPPPDSRNGTNENATAAFSSSYDQEENPRLATLRRITEWLLW